MQREGENEERRRERERIKKFIFSPLSSLPESSKFALSLIKVLSFKRNHHL